MSENNVQFRVNFLTEGGQYLMSTEWTTDRDAIIHLTDKINQGKNGIRATPETKGTGYITIPQPVRVG